MLSQMPFIPLRVQTEYSLGKSSIRTKQLASYCRNNMIPAVGLADSDNMFAALEFAMACAKEGVQPICGCDVSVKHDGYEGSMLLFAKSEEGYRNLMNVVSFMYKREVPRKGNPFIHFNELKRHFKGLISLNGVNSSLITNIISSPDGDAASIINEVQEHGGEAFIELQRYSDGSHKRLEPSLIQLAHETSVPIVATNTAQFLERDMHESADCLSCIVNSSYLVAEDRYKVHPEHYLKSGDEIKGLFSDIKEAVQNTALVARKCSFLLQPSKPMLPHFSKDLEEDDMLESSAKIGLKRRLEYVFDSEEIDKYWERLDYELSVIKRMRFSGYFLIVSDFIKWSKSQKIPVGPGRGSGAGSIVAWSLEITEVDPMKFGLFFERFLNPERVSMPDFDIDFCQSRRDEVIKYVTERYGSENVAHIITFGKLQARAVLRDVGRVLQIPYGLVDKICKMVPNNPAHPVTLKEAIDMDRQLKGMGDDDPEIDRMLKIALALEGIARHSSIHPAGVVIADSPIQNIVPLYVAPGSDVIALQFSMKQAEAAGLIKFDFLGLKTLTVLQYAVDLIKEEYGVDLNLNELRYSDKDTYEMLALGKTAGVFQFEGVGISEAMKKLVPSKIEDLIALSSLYRPGPMSNIKHYVARKHGEEKVSYIHEKLQPALEETYGIIVYQEQVMEIFKILGGYSLAEADLVRRAMGKKNKEEMKAQRELFVLRAVENGIEHSHAEEIFDVVDKFAGYGFNKSHATAYGIISYHTAYIKAHYPQVFFVASINLDIDDSDKIASFFMDAKYQYQIEVLPPCINKSDALFKIEMYQDKKALRFGLAGIKNVGMKVLNSIVAERNGSGPFKDLKDFVFRCRRFGLNKRMLENLIKSSALVEISPNHAAAMQEIGGLLIDADIYGGGEGAKQVSLGSLFSAASCDTVAKKEEVEAWRYSDKLAAEYSALGFYLTEHPLKPYENALQLYNIVKSTDVLEYLSENPVTLKLAGVVMSRRIRSGSRGKYAFMKMSDQFGSIDFSIFDEDLLLNKISLLEEGSVIFCSVSAKMDENGARIIAEDIVDMSTMMKQCNLRYKISIKSLEELKLVKRALKREGGQDICYPVAFAANLGFASVRFRNDATDYFISVDDVQELRQKYGVDVKDFI